jgi:hypothetical protein
LLESRANLVLLTATVTPHEGIANLKVADPERRLKEYLRALEFVAHLPQSLVGGVIFAENSGTDLAPMRDVVRGSSHVELLSIEPRQVSSRPERGYLETQLVVDAFEASAMLRDFDDPLVWKVTGRYQVRNIARIITRAPPGLDLHFNLRKYPEPWADMWIYGATRRGIGLLSTFSEQMREHLGPTEREMYGIISALVARGDRVSTRLAAEPRIVGVRGYDGVSYGSPAQRVKWLARSVGRRVLPSLHI